MDVECQRVTQNRNNFFNRSLYQQEYQTKHKHVKLLHVKPENWGLCTLASINNAFHVGAVLDCCTHTHTHTQNKTYKTWNIITVYKLEPSKSKHF